MEPLETGKKYDGIAEWWRERHRDSGYGVKQFERAVGFAGKGGVALDVGCGSSGRFVEILLKAGFAVEGLDVSEEMVRLAREGNPEGVYCVGDIAVWELPRGYDFICAWDSTFHLPIELQEPVLRKMCRGLKAGGILVYTFGGFVGSMDGADTIEGVFRGERFEYSSLWERGNLAILLDEGLDCVHLEYDQGPGEGHVYVIARRPLTGA